MRIAWVRRSVFLHLRKSHVNAHEPLQQRNLCLLSSQDSRLLRWENHGIIMAHNRQTHRQYLGKLLLSPPQKIDNPISYFKTAHAQIITSGFESNIFLINVLMKAYSKSDDLKSASTLFGRMPERNLISWSSIISVYNQNGCYEEALVLFVELRKGGFENPNEFVLASVIQSCSQLVSLENGLGLHGLVIKDAYNRNSHVGTSLIDFYAKTGDLNAATLAFDELEMKSVVTWTAIIMGFTLNGRSDVSLGLFKEMVCSDVVLDVYALSGALSACLMLEFIEEGKQIHAYVLRRAADRDISVSNMLIDFYVKCGEPKMGRIIFDHMVIKNAISWKMMIFGCMLNCFHWEALDLFRDMNRLGWMANEFVCKGVLNSCGSVGALDQGMQVHAYTVKINLDSVEFVTSSLIDMYCKCNFLIDARRVFLDTAKCSALCYHSMIDGYTRQGSLDEAISLFNALNHNVTPPSLSLFICLFSLSASLAALGVSMQLHSLMIKFGFNLERFCGCALIDVYSKFSSIRDVRHVFEEIEEKDIVVWNSMLSGYAIQSENEEALRLYLRLLHTGERPNGFTYVAVITVSSSLASLLHGLQFHNQAIKIGLGFNSFVANALMDMYAKCGSLDAARSLFNSILHRDIPCWNSMISIYAQYGDAEKALQIYEEMNSEGVKPDYVTFVVLMSACAHAGLVEDGFRQFKLLTKFGIEPGIEHYACIVSLLGRAGKLDEAKLLIENMPIQPTVIIWKSLLNACKDTGNLELGQHIGEMAILSDPKDSGSYTLLSNIFASKSMWTDGMKVMEKMDRNNVLKEAGYSWIEINKRVHLFLSRDRTHKQACLIYSLIDGLVQHIRWENNDNAAAVYAFV
ncbi:pentatricopeptide repeat-containing protein At4g39530 [Primulina tabacum]|uniref:pentatricopeptide repeat-containing protein At4g39530 n=1 Tax=Primulina tabacum TaxID=48773 RepID=UPI003F59C4A8